MKYRFLILIALILISCKKEENQSDILKKNKFEGLYHITFEGYNKDYIWILTEDLFYTLYPDSENSIGYETPVHYYIKEDKFYYCGIENVGKPTTLKKCMSDKSFNVYNIVGLDTLQSIDKSSKEVLIKLKEDINGKNIVMRKHIW